MGSFRTVHDVVEIAAFFIPESTGESVGYSSGARVESGRTIRVTEQTCPITHVLESKVPQGVDLNRFANTWSDHPVADLGVHPRELHAFGSRVKQSVGGIDPNAISRPP